MLDICGQVSDQKQIRAGFIGCGGHAFRNVYPCFQFTPVELVAACDLDVEKSREFARQFGAQSSYTDYRTMLEKEDLDAVFIVTGYDKNDRPLYPQLAKDCLNAGCHVWIEKPPAASCADIEMLQQVSRETGKNVMVGFKKMFFPVNQKAKELMQDPDFGTPSLLLLQYPQYVPTLEEMQEYSQGPNSQVKSFLDHLCHPVSLMMLLFGMPKTLYFERAASGAGNAQFTFDNGAVCSLALTCHASSNGGMERTMIIGDKSCHISIENNIRLSLNHSHPTKYGKTTSFFEANENQAATVWEPEFSLGNLYNKGLFLLGYYDEINEFALSILENREPANGTLDQAWNITRIFEAFLAGPGKKSVIGGR